MSVRAGIIGADVMGADHTRIFAQDLPGAELRVVCDEREDHARAVGEINGGQLVNIKINNNAACGCDVRGELVGEQGSVDPGTPVYARYNVGLQSAERFAGDWRPRFADAYRRQNKAWLQSIEADEPDRDAANARDGDCATIAAAAGIASLVSAMRAKVKTDIMPPLYAGRGNTNIGESLAQ